MATLLTPCMKCASKGIGVFQCQGCSNVFCRKHANEHRETLSQHLDDLVHEHDQLFQFIGHGTESTSHPLITQIDQWEENSMKKIEEVAQNIRQDILQYIRAQKDTASETLKSLAQRLRKAREEDDYVENDLRIWTTQLEHLKKEMITATNSSITLHEQSHDILIPSIQLSTTKHQVISNERFLRSVGDIHLEDNGQLATHGSQKRSDAFLYGQNEYTHGKHHVRFIINKNDLSCITTFGITSMQSQLAVYGWSSDDQTVGGRYRCPAESANNQDDMKGETILQIQFSIDCDNRTISYFNERTGCTKDMHVDLDSCRFPWQLYFYLYDIGDRVRLLTINRML